MTPTRTIAMLLLGAALLPAPAGCRAGGASRTALPAGLPADVPLPEGAALRSSQDLGKKGLNLIWESAAEGAAAVAGLRARMAAAGWGLVAEAVLEDGTFLSYRKGPRSVAVGVTPEGTGSLIGITYFAVPWVEGAEEGAG